MSDLSIVALVLAACFVSMFFLAKKLFGQSIFFKVFVYVQIFSCCLVLSVFYMGQNGVGHIYWVTPLNLVVLLLGTRSVFREIHLPLKEIQESIKMLATGNLSTHLQVGMKGEKNNEITQLAGSVNTMKNTLASYMHLAQQIKNGQLASNVEIEEKDMLGQSLDGMRKNLKSILEEIKNVVNKGGHEGNLDQRIELSGKQGVWAELGTSINDLLNSISVPFKEINSIVNAMSEGDLTKRYEGGAQGQVGELAFKLNLALDTLNDLLLQISTNTEIVRESIEEMLGTSEEMNTNTGEIASAIAEMSNGARSQVSKVDESSTLVENIMNSSTDMGAQAEEINRAAVMGTENTDKGLKMIQKVGYSMNDIISFSNETTSSIDALSQRSNEISRVLSVITDIASQTNLLALNAAIEAAQAGDAGRGFAVVAEEIRKLAEDSRKSAKEIETLIKDVQTDTEKTARAIKVMNDSIKGGEEASNDASEAFKEIATSTAQTLRISENILNATRAQIDDIKNVVAITESVVVIAEETAAGTEEVASSATELSSGMENYTSRSQQLADITQALQEQVRRFKLLQKEEMELTS